MLIVNFSACKTSTDFVGSGGVAVVVCETVLLYYRGCVTVDAVFIVVVVG